jgi:C-5 cytosine-specific DNA methylase
MTIESYFDITLVASLARRAKRVQQNYRPIIAVHKWFASRQGTMFRGLILSEFGVRPLPETFSEANNLPGRVVADPFIGRGTPLVEANRVGCDVWGFGINPRVGWIVREEARFDYNSTPLGLAAIMVPSQTATDKIDLFAGAGGLTLGFKAAGLKTVSAVQIVPVRVEMYATRPPEANTENAEIQQFDLTRYRRGSKPWTGDHIAAVLVRRARQGACRQA